MSKPALNGIPMQARGIRLPASTWAEIDRTALALGMHATELVRRHLQTAFASDVQNRTRNVHDDDLVEVLP